MRSFTRISQSVLQHTLLQVGVGPPGWQRCFCAVPPTVASRESDYLMMDMEVSQVTFTGTPWGSQ